jgi:hypothetical protein
VPQAGDARDLVWGAGGLDAPAMRVLRPDDLFARIGADGLIGFGESYLAGDWVALPATAGEPGPAGRRDPLVELLTVFATDLPRLIPGPLQRLRRFAVRCRPKSEENTPGGSRSNIARHYDLSNELFATFLDPTLTYSAAIFGPEEGGPNEQGGTTDGDELVEWDELPAAQARKIDRLLDACGVGAGGLVLPPESPPPPPQATSNIEPAAHSSGIKRERLIIDGVSVRRAGNIVFDSTGEAQAYGGGVSPRKHWSECRLNVIRPTGAASAGRHRACLADRSPEGGFGHSPCQKA